MAEPRIFRPVVVPVIISNALVTVIFVAGSALLFWFLSRVVFMPANFFNSVDLIIALLGVLFFAQTAARALWVRLTEAYKVETGFLFIRRGWATRTAEQIPSTNIADAETVLPLLLRFFGVGSILVSTNDGSVHVMKNVRHPQALADEIRQQRLGRGEGGGPG